MNRAKLQNIYDTAATAWQWLDKRLPKEARRRLRANRLRRRADALEARDKRPVKVAALRRRAERLDPDGC